MRLAPVLLLAVALPAVGQTFEQANQTFQEKSYARACDAFTTLSKVNAPGREVRAKKAIACLQVGRGSDAELRALADDATKDFAQALAIHALFERGGATYPKVAAALRQPGFEARQQDEARALFKAASLRKLQQSQWSPSEVESTADVALSGATDAPYIAAVKLFRGRSRVQNNRIAEGEADLQEVGKGTTDSADDALLLLGQRREQEARFVEALEFYDRVVTRFSPQTSNALADAKYRATSIRAPRLSIRVPTNEFPGVAPVADLDFRNVATAQLTLSRVDPFTGSAESLPSDPLDLPVVKTISTWSMPLKVKSQHAPGVETLSLPTTEPGLYRVEVRAGNETARAWALISTLSVVTKTDRQQLWVGVFDTETGAAQANAEVRVATNTGEPLTGVTDADGLVRLPLAEKRSSQSMFVWVRKGAQLTFSAAGNASWSSWNRQRLSYVMIDRPVFKPGETAGLKLFLRTREEGPSTPLAQQQATIRVTDPQGKEAFTQDVITNRFGTASVSWPIPPKATLGQYRVTVLGAESFQQSNNVFRVEEYKAPEFAVTVEPLGNARPGDKVRFKVKVAYFSGGPVANASGRALVSISPWTHTFPRWPDDPVDDAMNPWDLGRGEYRRRYRGYVDTQQTTVLFKTGADGTAEVEVEPQPGVPDSDGLQYAVEVLVTDASRREIQGSGTLKLSRREVFADFKTDHVIYRPGERVQVQLRAEDANGRPASADVVLRLLRVGDGTAAPATVNEVRTRIVNGTGRAVVDADVLGAARLELLEGTTENPALLASSDLWLTNEAKPLVTAKGFQMYVDRAPLKVGDALRVLVAGERSGGHALLTLESETVVVARSVALQGRARFVELKLPPEAAPNAWLQVTRFEDTRVLTRSLPIKVQGSAVELAVKVELGRASAEPGAALTAAISAAGAPTPMPSETALSVVDESIFAIAPERTDFLSFFGRTARRLSVRTAISTHQRTTRARPAAPEPRKPGIATPGGNRAPEEGSFASSGGATKALSPAAAPVLADDESPRLEEKAKKEAPAARRSAEAAPEPDGPVKVRSDFSTSAGWFPSIGGKTGTPTAQGFTLKDSLTSWKAVATVVTEGPFLGQGAAKVRAQKALMVRLQAPRFFIEGDEVVLSAVVENHLPKKGPVEVSITAPGFKPLTPTQVTLQLEPEQVTRFDARFKVEALGERTLRATVKGGGTADAMEWTLPALVHGAAQRQFFSGRISDSQRVSFLIPEKRKAALTRVELNLSPTVLATVFDALPYLAEYPYGCVEQTLSRFVPAAIARRTASMLNAPTARVPAQLDDMVVKGLQRLTDFQHSDGGWGWWSTDSTNLWMTAYVVSSLALAKSAGLEVRPEVLARGRQALENSLGAGLNAPETHAFMVYALATSGGAPAAALTTVFERRTSLTPRARAQLALALLAQKDPRARVAVENLDDVVKAAQSRADASVGEATDVWNTSAAIEATAFTLLAYLRHDPRSPLIKPLTDFLVLRRNGGKWRNTRDTAFSLYALSELAQREAAALRAGTLVIAVNGREVKRVKYSRGGLDLTQPVVLSDAAFVSGQNELTITHDGGAGTGYFSAQVDVFNMNDFIRGVGGDVQLKRTYTLLGQPSVNRAPGIDAEYGMPVESGVRVRVDLELTANKPVEFVMVEDLKPAGFEAVLLQSGPQVCNFACAHAELRTDRVALFVTAIPVGTTKLSYELRAEVPGRFAALPARFEAMYAPEIQATADEMRFEVRDAPGGQAGR